MKAKFGAIDEYRKRVKSAFRNLGKEYKRWGQNAISHTKNLPLHRKIIYTGALAIGLGVSGYTFGLSGMLIYAGLESLTMVSFSLNQGISRGVQDTKQKQVLFMLPNFFTGMQSLLAGGLGRALMGLNGVIMNGISSFIPDRVLDAKNQNGTSKNRRFKLGMAFSTISIGGSLALAKFTSLWELVPATAGVMVATSSVLSSSISEKGNRDPQLRGLQGGSQFLNAFYSAHLGLPLKVSTDLLDAQAHASAIMKFHVPTVDEHGKAIPTVKRLTHMVEKIFLLKDLEGFTPIQLAHPNKVEEEQIAERKGLNPEDITSMENDHRPDFFKILVGSTLDRENTRKSYTRFVDSLSVLDNETLKRVWGVASCDDIKAKIPLSQIFEAQRQYRKNPHSDFQAQLSDLSIHLSDNNLC